MDTREKRAAVSHSISSFLVHDECNHFPREEAMCSTQNWIGCKRATPSEKPRKSKPDKKKRSSDMNMKETPPSEPLLDGNKKTRNK